MGRQIADEAGYQRSLEWLVTKAKILEDPLLEEETRTKLEAQYDLVAAKVQEYRRGELAAKFPGLKKQYEMLGWKYQDMSKSAPASSGKE